MPKTNSLLIIAISVLLTTLFSCTKDDTKYDVYFWTSIDPANEELNLIIDGANLGQLPFRSLRPECNNDSLLPKLIFRQLSVGKYDIIARNNEGNDKSVNVLKIKSNGIGGGGKITRPGSPAGMSVLSIKDCIVIELYYK